MSLKLTRALLGAATLAVLTIGATAAPLSPNVVGDARAMSLIENVHACHRDVQEGRRSWHYHRGRDCERYEAAPPRRYQEPPRRTYEPRRPERHCWQDCKYVGPIKVCKQRCNW